MGLFTGQDKGTKARKGRREHKVRGCGACNRPLNSNGNCPVCSAITRAHSSGKAAVPARPATHNCADGRTRTMYGGVCPGPYC